MNKSHVQAGDVVQVISGNHRSAQGKVLRVIRAKNQVIVEGVRMIKKHMRRSQERPQGEIIEREGPLHISNVKLLKKTEKSELRSDRKNIKIGVVSDADETKKKVTSTKAKKLPKE